jgi:hypothetical protein
MATNGVFRGLIRIIPVIIITFLLSPLVAITIDGAPSQAAMSLEITLEPNAVEVFPTNSWGLPLKFLGTVHFTKVRPDDVLIDLEVSADVEWWNFVEPQTMKFSQVGEHLRMFEVTLLVPPMMAGPLTVNLEVVSTIRLYGRDESDSATSVITFVSNADEFMTNVPQKIAVLSDGGVDGQIRVHNMLDEELEFHISALGDWNERIPDLDFQQPVVLGPLEMMQVRFHGKLSDSVESGEYQVELALWTMLDDQQMYVTSQNVTLFVTREEDMAMSSIIRYGLAIVLIGIVVLIVLLMYIVVHRTHEEGGW